MKRAHRMSLSLSGDLARALAWEGSRRGMAGERLALDLLEQASASIVSGWREAMTSEKLKAAKPGKQEMQSLQSVLAKAYGPVRPGRSPRRGRVGR